MKRLILVSDGDPEVTQALEQIGVTLDLTVRVEPAAQLAAVARKLKPNLIVLDVQPRDALEVLSHLKTGLATRTTPVVVVAAVDSSTMREMALEIGADAFVAKPLGPDFLAKVATFLDGR